LKRDYLQGRVDVEASEAWEIGKKIVDNHLSSIAFIPRVDIEI